MAVLSRPPFGSSDLDLSDAPAMAVPAGEICAKNTDSATKSLTVGLIDPYRLSQECLVQAFERLSADMCILPIPSVADYTARPRAALDLVIYRWHAGDTPEPAAMQNIAAMRASAPGVPIIVFSDVDDADQIRTIRSTLNAGAHGFVPIRSTGISIAAAAIRFVKDGGTFAPLDVLLTHRVEQAAPFGATPRRIQSKMPQDRLTSRQVAVLSHLQQGKANKIIAYELGMSESTVKVHVRNIMRKMGATNRTQAAYKAQKLWDDSDTARIRDL